MRERKGRYITGLGIVVMAYVSAACGATPVTPSKSVVQAPLVHTNEVSLWGREVTATTATPVPTAVPVATPPPVYRSVPPRSAAPAVSYPPGSIEAIITAAANANGVNPSWMISIAECESGLRPNAYNPAGPYIGLFQFLPSTFAAHGGTNIYDPVQQSNITAFMLAHGGARSWPVCSLR